MICGNFFTNLGRSNRAWKFSTVELLVNVIQSAPSFSSLAAAPVLSSVSGPVWLICRLAYMSGEGRRGGGEGRLIDAPLWSKMETHLRTRPVGPLLFPLQEFQIVEDFPANYPAGVRSEKMDGEMRAAFKSLR